MRGVTLLVTGILIGSAVQSAVGQQDRFVTLNHVGIVVDNLDEVRQFYTKTMGFREAWRNNQTTTFVQVSRDTFLELMPSTPTRRPGLDHFGFQVEDAHATTARLKQAGLTVSDVRISPSNLFVSSVTDPWGIRFELHQVRPDSLLKKAMDSWR
jgi:catechol 2,3-dioxygenase-like lactoylglutathione lyase family enzyme